MVQPISRDESDARKHDSVFSARQVELEESASNRPQGITGNFPYVMEITTGHIHPFSTALAARSDLVVGCYDLSGSFDPADADPYYDPQGVYSANERRSRVQTVAPQTAADRRAADATTRKQLRAELEAEVRAELEAKYAAAPVATPVKKRGGNKSVPATALGATQVVPTMEAPVPESQPIMEAPTAEVEEGTAGLDTAFEDAMRG